jgi:hypothetical protein
MSDDEMKFLERILGVSCTHELGKAKHGSQLLTMV